MALVDSVRTQKIVTNAHALLALFITKRKTSAKVNIE